MTTRIIRTDDDAQALARMIAARGKYPVTVSIAQGASRSHAQNRLIWKWNGEIAGQRGDVTTADVHRENKLLIGCPILMRHAAFNAFVQNLSGLTYEEKLQAMDYVAVTSTMTTKEMIEFADTVYSKFTGMGFALTHPDCTDF